MPQTFETLEAAMRHAIGLASRGSGLVEPNPVVGAVVVDDRLNLLGEGWHQRYGGPHAEVAALQSAGEAARGATLVVTLEPCCHHGQTPPCTEAVIDAGIARVVVGIEDPSPHADGAGLDALRQAGVSVQRGGPDQEIGRLNAPFLQLVTGGRPWVHAKWAMTLDGRIAAPGGHSQWISNEASRQVVHELRGRVDAVLVGIGTALADDPLLTARPPGHRVATRIVLDSSARLPLDSQLVSSADEVPVLVACRKEGDAEGPTGKTVPERIERLRDAGVEVLELSAADGDRVDVGSLLEELGRRRLTHLLVEGGSEVLGSLSDGGWIDEAHVFVAAKLLGGHDALSAVGGQGLPEIPLQATLELVELRELDGDVYWRGVRAGAGAGASDFC